MKVSPVLICSFLLLTCSIAAWASCTMAVPYNLTPGDSKGTETLCYDVTGTVPITDDAGCKQAVLNSAGSCAGVADSDDCEIAYLNYHYMWWNESYEDISCYLSWELQAANNNHDPFDTKKGTCVTTVQETGSCNMGQYHGPC